MLLSLGITFVVFVLTELVPSNAAATNLGEQAAGDPAAVAAFKHHYGLDRPFPVRYAIYLDHLVHGRPRPVVAHARRRSRTTSASSSRRRQSWRSTRSCSRRSSGSRSASSPRCAATGRPTMCFASLARRHLDADVLDRARRALRRLLPARLVPGRRAARPRHEPAAERHRPLHDRRAARRQLGPLRAGVPPPRAAGARARRVQRQPAHALHALGGARGDRQRLRARRAREGAAGADRRRCATSCARRCRPS